MVSGTIPSAVAVEIATVVLPSRVKRHGEIASMMAESLADLVLLPHEEDRATLLAHVVSACGQMYLEKSGALEGGSSATH